MVPYCHHPILVHSVRKPIVCNPDGSIAHRVHGGDKVCDRVHWQLVGLAYVSEHGHVAVQQVKGGLRAMVKSTSPAQPLTSRNH